MLLSGSYHLYRVLYALEYIYCLGSIFKNKLLAISIIGSIIVMNLKFSLFIQTVLNPSSEAVRQKTILPVVGKDDEKTSREPLMFVNLHFSTSQSCVGNGNWKI